MSRKLRLFSILLTVIIVLAVTILASAAPLQGIQLYLPLLVKEYPIVTLPTPTPTETAQPTATLTPTPTDTPTETPSGDVQILPNHSFYVDDLNYLHVFGEVQNNTSDYLKYVEITANFYDSAGQIVGNDFTFTTLDSVPPGEKACFHILTDEPAGWDHYQFEQPDYWTTGSPLPNITVLSHSGSLDPTFNWYELIGEARNDQGSRVEYVSPIATLYNASGTIINCDFTFVNSTHLDPGQTSSFKFLISGQNLAETASYRLQVDGIIK